MVTVNYRNSISKQVSSYRDMDCVRRTQVDPTPSS